MTTQYGLIVQFTKRDGSSFRCMDDAMHPSWELAFVEAQSFYKEESVIHINGIRSKIMGIFAMDDEGSSSTYMNRNQIIDAIEKGEADLERAEAEDCRYGSYARQHALRTFDVVA